MGRKVRRDRPLLDPKRRRYARAALDAKQRAHERELLTGAKDPARHERTRSHLAECLALVSEAPDE